MTKSDDGPHGKDDHGKDDAKKHLADALKRKLEAAPKPHNEVLGKSGKTGKASPPSQNKGRSFRHQGR
jgi:hypothetical protein